MSEKKLPRYGVTIIKASDERPVKKSNKSEQLDAREELSAADWISPPIDLIGLKELETESSILPQCIRAYKNNIAGFGIGIRYKDDIEETTEMAAEYTRAEDIIQLLNLEQDTKEVFEDLMSRAKPMVSHISK